VPFAFFANEHSRAGGLQPIRCTSLDRQRMDAVAHQVHERVVHHPVLLNPRLAIESRAGDPHAEVPRALAGMSNVQVAFVNHLQRRRREGALQS
jgi:hypothetical protein